MSTTFTRRMILGAVAAIAVATLASGCGNSTTNNQTPGDNPSSPSASKSAPKGGGSAF